MSLLFPDDPVGPPPDGVPLNAPEQRRALVALSLVPSLGAARTRMLVGRLGSPRAVLRASRSQLQAIDGIGAKTAEAILTFDAEAEAEREIEQAASIGATYRTLWDDGYPERLRQVYDPPPVLWMLGEWTPADEASLAVVGTRRCTKYGRLQARRFAQELARKGVTVVSGLAYGIDAEAHAGALEAGGRTVSVLGSGLGRIYPEKHTDLAHRMAERGAVLSEFPFSAEPDARRFPARNRIVSGMTLGTLVVESRARGGSLITARMALEQNREVFAVPGNVGKESSLGCNHLIQAGQAKLVLDADDILDELPVSIRDAGEEGETIHAAPSPPPDLPHEEEALYEALTTTPVHIDVLCDATDMATSDALVHLLSLEFKGLVRQMAGKQFVRVG